VVTLVVTRWLQIKKVVTKMFKHLSMYIFDILIVKMLSLR
jgi:hypothetical protein